MILTVQALLGHADVSTAMIYTDVLNRGGRGVRSPAESWEPDSTGNFYDREYTETTFGFCRVSSSKCLYKELF